MKFILLDRAAVAQLVQARQVQSVDFADGARVAELLTTGAVAPEGTRIGTRVTCVASVDGLYILGSQTETSRCLVFDTEAADPFGGRQPSDALLIFQKTLRFALKIWDGMSFSTHAEHAVSGKQGTKFVLFPLPFTSASNYRITLDRLHREGTTTGDHLLVFRAGFDEGGGATETPSRSRFNLALAGLAPSAERAASRLRDTGDAGRLPPLEVTSLAGGRTMPTGISVPFDNWLPLLSDVQTAFVNRPLSGPERLEGPAGTGKTLALLLKCIATLRKAETTNREHHAVFITHSLATKRAIEEKLRIIDVQERFWARTRTDAAQSLTVTTLQEWCGNQLGTGLAEVEYLDRDAAESKALQQLYITEALEEVIATELKTHRLFMSASFFAFLEREEHWHIAEMMQHEIGIMIKGRAREDLDRYKTLPPLVYNLPLETPGDRGFVFLVYRAYQRRLKETGQFDTDDIVLSAMNQLDTPIWRRRREHEGFDSIFLDEAHLFNLNELSIVHFLPRDAGLPPIAFAVDRSQAIGDRGLERGTIDEHFTAPGTAGTKMKTIFRSAPKIVDLATAVTSAGATLFTNFDNPLVGATSGFTAGEEQFARDPAFILSPNDAAMIERAISAAADMADRVPNGRSGVALVVFDPALMEEFKRVVRERNRPFEVIERRGDVEVVNRAKVAGRYILAGPEYVGGLEFDGVILVGIDQGRVPPLTIDTTGEGRHFLRYAAHNLLYVAISRARYEVLILANRERGLSELLSDAQSAELLLEQQD